MATMKALISPAIIRQGSRVYDLWSSSCSSLAVSGIETSKIDLLLHCGKVAEGVRVRFLRKRSKCQTSTDATSVLGSSSMMDPDADYVPTPIVLIVQDSNSDATIVEVSFGDRLGALLDTMKALKDLGLDVAKGTVTTESSVIQTKFFITRSDTGRKVEDPDMLERIRLTIINNLLKYHPESSEWLAMGEAFGIKAPEKKLDVNIATHIQIKEDGPKRSLLYIETADRPGLLMEIIKILADININVESAEIDTEGLVAKDKFYVNYGGASLNSSLSQAKHVWQLVILAVFWCIWGARNRKVFQAEAVDIGLLADRCRRMAATWAKASKHFDTYSFSAIWRDGSCFLGKA